MIGGYMLNVPTCLDYSCFAFYARPYPALFGISVLTFLFLLLLFLKRGQAIWALNVLLAFMIANLSASYFLGMSTLNYYISTSISTFTNAGVYRVDYLPRHGPLQFGPHLDEIIRNPDVTTVTGLKNLGYRTCREIEWVRGKGFIINRIISCQISQVASNVGEYVILYDAGAYDDGDPDPKLLKPDFQSITSNPFVNEVQWKEQTGWIEMPGQTRDPKYRAYHWVRGQETTSWDSPYWERLYFSTAVATR
jgi:hypothetical protein